MGYTMSFEASVKVQRGAVAGLLRHNGRDVDRENGREVRHANQGIVAELTSNNETLVSDGKGSWEPCGDLSEIEAALDARLAEVKKPLRKDAVVLRPLILQLDPDWYAAHSGEQEREQAAACMLEWAADTFGAKNLIYASLHNDEASPHLHVGFCPVTEDGRLSQKDWFSSPTALREMHQDLRKHMAEAGYDIDMKNRKPGKYAKRMSVSEYKDFCQLQEEARKIEIQQGQLSRWSERLHEQQTDLQKREVELQKQKDELQRRERAVEKREADQEDRKTALEARERAIRVTEGELPSLAKKAVKTALEAEIEAARKERRPVSRAKAEQSATEAAKAAAEAERKRQAQQAILKAQEAAEAVRPAAASRGKQLGY